MRQPASSSISSTSSRLFGPLLKTLDHHCLNEIDGLANPTAENIAVWIFARMKKALPQLSGVIVYETGDCYAEYYGE